MSPPIAAALAGTLLALFTASSPGAGLPVLVYHRLVATDDMVQPGPTAMAFESFEAQMRYLHENGYATLDTGDIGRFVAGNPYPGRIVAIHFDDGWNSARRAIPVLQRYGFKATFWVFPGTGIGEPHMDWGDVEAIAATPGLEVQSHTMTHPGEPGASLVDWVEGRVPGKGVAEARRELAESRRVLEETLRRPVRGLAWPGGAFNEQLIELAQQAGYQAMFTVDDGLVQPGDDPHRLKRTIVHGACGQDQFIRVLGHGLYRPGGGDH